MATTKRIKITFGHRDSAGERIVITSELVDDGKVITRPTNYCTGGVDIILARSGEWDIALSAARRGIWPYWIGGCGYEDVPVDVQWQD